jgi:hypothetical protein
MGRPPGVHRNIVLKLMTETRDGLRVRWNSLARTMSLMLTTDVKLREKEAINDDVLPSPPGE